MKKPLVSIITVVFNGEKYLEQTINSVINQTYKNIEYIIVDGGSTDGTPTIIKQYKKHIDYWVSESDKGLYDAMNKGIEMANGELIGMINSDDWYEFNAVEVMVNAYLTNPTKTIFHADRFDVYENGLRKVRKFNPSTLKFKYYGMTYNHPGMFITQCEYDKHMYNIKLKSISDYQFVMEALLKNSDSFMYIEKSIVNFRLGGISTQNNILEGTIEGYSARKAAGLNFLQRIVAATFGLSVNFYYSIKNKFHEKKH